MAALQKTSFTGPTAAIQSSTAHDDWLEDLGYSVSNLETYSGEAAAFVGPGNFSETISLSGFGLSIPRDARVVGIKTSFWGISGHEYIQSGQQLTISGSPTGDVKQHTSYWPTSWTEFTEGGSSDLWGCSITAANINDGDVGLDFQVYNDGPTYAETPIVKTFLMKVYYYTPYGETVVAVASASISKVSGVDTETISRVGGA